MSPVLIFRQIQLVEEDEGMSSSEYIRSGMAELKVRDTPIRGNRRSVTSTRAGNGRMAKPQNSRTPSMARSRGAVW
jgi:hypothetical protein